MKEPKGKALPIDDCVSKPKDVSQYSQRIGDSVSMAKNVGSEEQIGGTAMPPTHYSGDNVSVKQTEKGS